MEPTTHKQQQTHKTHMKNSNTKQYTTTQHKINHKKRKHSNTNTTHAQTTTKQNKKRRRTNHHNKHKCRVYRVTTLKNAYFNY